MPMYVTSISKRADCALKLRWDKFCFKRRRRDL